MSIFEYLSVFLQCCVFWNMMYRFLLIFSLIGCFFLSACDDISHETKEYHEDDTYSDELEAAMELLDANMGNSKALTYADVVISLANDENATEQLYYGITQKMTIYMGMAEYGKLENFVDSVYEHTGLANDEYYYGYSVFLRSLSNIEQGKFKIAIRYAQELYDASKDESYIARAVEDSLDINLPQYIRNRCNALTCLGLANREMGQVDAAMSFFDEGISICSEFLSGSDSRVAEQAMLLQLEMMSYKMESALKYSDKDAALNITRSFESALESYEANLVSLEENDEDDYDNNAMKMQQLHLIIQTTYASIYCDLNNPEAAREHLEKARGILENVDMMDHSSAGLHAARAKYYTLVGQERLAIAYSDSAASYFHRASKPSAEIEMLKLKVHSIHKARAFEDEYGIFQRILALSDSVADQRQNSQIEQMQTIYGFDKLSADNERLAQERMLWILISIVVVMGALIVIVFLNHRKSKEKQKILSQQKELLETEVARQTAELREQKNEIEQKNRDITDSITYAERIQSSILPDLATYNHGIEGAFAFFIPCNIVSGDFYWATKHGDNLVIACSDCTGHGVPGAFVSMIGSTSLNEITSGPELMEPGEILESLDRNIFKVLGQNGGEARDGMDISLISYNPNTHIVKCAGAKRPVYLFRADGELVEFKGTKRSIGDTDELSRTKPFETQEFEVSAGDTIYMCSDGLGDQFGGQEKNGPNGKRLMSGGLRKMLAQVRTVPIAQQRDLTEKLYWEWRGTCPQLDDISLVGIRF